MRMLPKEPSPQQPKKPLIKNSWKKWVVAEVQAIFYTL